MKTAAEKATVKEQLDAIENLIHALKVFNADPENDCDVDFYSTFDDMYAALDLTIPIYNKVRNYATKNLTRLKNLSSTLHYQLWPMAGTRIKKMKMAL